MKKPNDLKKKVFLFIIFIAFFQFPILSSGFRHFEMFSESYKGEQSKEKSSGRRIKQDQEGYLGILGGLNFDYSKDTKERSLGFTFGVMGEMTFYQFPSESTAISLEMNVLYQKTRQVYNFGEISSGAINVPFLVKIKYPKLFTIEKLPFTPFLGVGLDLNYQHSSELTYKETEERYNYDYQKFYLGVLASLGFELDFDTAGIFFVECRFSMAISAASPEQMAYFSNLGYTDEVIPARKSDILVLFLGWKINLF